ncbi:hypothetical protein [Micromonospora sp. DT31]|uniref:hypothetical protein n=1 Tax=Micromonospora sp. DT31 TaxID=3393434 RepID=UPI003CF2F9E7
MGLDLYVGPLTRYHLNDWLTIMQQIGARDGLDVRIVRAQEDDDRETDPDVVYDAVRGWQQWLGEALGAPADWPEGTNRPYWTDKPDWDGFGAVLLFAAYDERPDLQPGPWDKPDSPRAFADAPAFQAASAQPERYLSLLAGVEWWLPLATDPLVIEAPRPGGQPTRMASVGRLEAELRLLNERTGLLAGYDPAELRRGPTTDHPTVGDMARFGLAVMLDLAETALTHRQPFLLDY